MCILIYRRLCILICRSQGGKIFWKSTNSPLIKNEKISPDLPQGHVTGFIPGASGWKIRIHHRILIRLFEFFVLLIVNNARGVDVLLIILLSTYVDSRLEVWEWIQMVNHQNTIDYEQEGDRKEFTLPRRSFGLGSRQMLDPNQPSINFEQVKNMLKEVEQALREVQ